MHSTSGIGLPLSTMLAMAASSTWIERPNTQGSCSACTTVPSQRQPSSARAISHAGLTGSFSNGSKPATSTRGALSSVVMQGPQRNIRKYIRKMLTTSSVAAVGICTRITAFLSGSSSSAAGTMLKLAAIGVISVPQ